MVKARAGADVQISSVGGNSAGLSGGFFLRIAGGDLDAVVGGGNAYLGAEQGRKQVGNFALGQRCSLLVSLRLICGDGAGLVGFFFLRLNAAGGFGGLPGRVSAIGKGGDRKSRDAEHHGQNCGQNTGNPFRLILHGHCPPVHGTGWRQVRPA